MLWSRVSGWLPPLFRQSLYADSVCLTPQPPRQHMMSRYAVGRAAGGRELTSHRCVRAFCGDTSSGTWQMCVGVRVSGCDRDSAAGLKARGIHCCPSFFVSFAQTTVAILCTTCVYTHKYRTVCRLYMNYRCYQTPQGNLFTQIGVVRSVDWIFNL